ncbi:MAG TPA: hypothetical protein VFH48_03780 [Chloroflexota bacterium]|nr:hypothetical protein [Chloroflexota bacterium]
MPSAAKEAYAAVVEARGANGETDWTALQAEYLAEYERLLAERHNRLMTDARAAYRAMDGWSTVKSREDWEQVVAQTDWLSATATSAPESLSLRGERSA